MLPTPGSALCFLKLLAKLNVSRYLIAEEITDLMPRFKKVRKIFFEILFKFFLLFSINV